MHRHLFRQYSHPCVTRPTGSAFPRSRPQHSSPWLSVVVRHSGDASKPCQSTFLKYNYLLEAAQFPIWSLYIACTLLSASKAIKTLVRRTWNGLTARWLNFPPRCVIETTKMLLLYINRLEHNIELVLLTFHHWPLLDVPFRILILQIFLNVVCIDLWLCLLLSVPLLYHSMGQIIKSVFLSVYVCMYVCMCVCMCVWARLRSHFPTDLHEIW